MPRLKLGDTLLLSFYFAMDTLSQPRFHLFPGSRDRPGRGFLVSFTFTFRFTEGVSITWQNINNFNVYLSVPCLPNQLI